MDGSKGYHTRYSRTVEIVRVHNKATKATNQVQTRMTRRHMIFVDLILGDLDYALGEHGGTSVEVQGVRTRLDNPSMVRSRKCQISLPWK